MAIWNRGSLVTVTKASWTLIGHPPWSPGPPVASHLQLIARSATASNTATLTVWGSNDGGTTYFPLVLTSLLTPAKNLGIAVGTERVGSGAYVDSIVLSIGPATHVYIAESSPGTDNFEYQVGAV